MYSILCCVFTKDSNLVHDTSTGHLLLLTHYITIHVTIEFHCNFTEYVP